MGRASAEAMAAATDLTTALHWHLSANHYPPVPASMVEPAKTAIILANQGMWDSPVLLPNGVTHRVHGDSVPAQVLIEHLHLDAFLTQED